MEPADINLELALKLLSLPRDLGPHPENQEAVVVSNGRYGPYVKCGSETRSLPNGTSPLEITLSEALALLAQPKTRGRGRAAPREPLRVFEASPVTSQPINLLDPETLTFEQAVALLAARAVKGPSKKKTAKKKATKKKAAKKKTTKKKTSKKTATKKKTTAKKKSS
jgi:DNA topoisomerase-1